MNVPLVFATVHKSVCLSNWVSAQLLWFSWVELINSQSSQISRSRCLLVGSFCRGPGQSIDKEQSISDERKWKNLLFRTQALVTWLNPVPRLQSSLKKMTFSFHVECNGFHDEIVDCCSPCFYICLQSLCSTGSRSRSACAALICILICIFIMVPHPQLLVANESLSLLYIPRFFAVSSFVFVSPIIWRIEEH